MGASALVFLLLLFASDATTVIDPLAHAFETFNVPLIPLLQLCWHIVPLDETYLLTAHAVIAARAYLSQVAFSCVIVWPEVIKSLW